MRMLASALRVASHWESAPAKSSAEKSNYNASIDVFFLGVATIFTIGEVFPCDPLAYTYVDERTGLVVYCSH